MSEASLMKRLMKEFADLQANCPEGIRVHINEHNLTELQAEIDGPEGELQFLCVCKS